MEKRLFGTCPEGEVWAYNLSGGGLNATVITYGARVTELKVPDAGGAAVDVVLGYDDMDGYLSDGDPYFGAAIGRCGNRIGGAAFTLNGREYRLTANDGTAQLHGGIKGFADRLWDVDGCGEDWLKLSIKSADGEEGYPGNLTAWVTYRLKDKSLIIEYSASSDADTVCNLTNHSYFNLNGHSSGDILRHRLRIDSDLVTACDDNLICDGTLKKVKGTPLDLNASKEIGEGIGDFSDETIKSGNGYDVNYCLRGEGFRSVAFAESDKSGITMEVLTDLPGVQLYTANYIDRLSGKGGAVYRKNAAFCLETQGYPNSPNVPSFPPVTLKKGETYSTKTVYKFGR